MPDRPYTLLSCGMSIDGYLEGATESRLLLSNDADLDRVDAVRAASDAILVGAATVRKDNPRLQVRSPARRDERVASGRRPSPTKVTVTGRPSWMPGRTSSPSVTPRSWSTARARRWRRPASGLARWQPWSMGSVGGHAVGEREDLYARVRRLMVEGGGMVHTQFLTADLADELHLVVAPLFVGDSRARRFVNDGRFPWNPHRRATLAEVRQIDDVVLLRYALSSRFRGP